jgi:hypothetical protein
MALVTKRNWKTLVFVNKEGEMTSRVCADCGELKSESDFGKMNNGIYGKRSDCFPCYYKKYEKSVIVRRHKHRAKKHGLPSSMTYELREKALAEQGYNCILSGEKNVVTEHLIPLSWGTGFGDTYGNIVFMSKALNSSKHNKNVFEWIKTQPQEYQDRFYNVLVPMMAERNDMTTEQYEEFVNNCYENRRV